MATSVAPKPNNHYDTKVVVIIFVLLVLFAAAKLSGLH